MEERRVFARINTRFPLRFLDPHTGRESQTETVDVSANGVSFITKENLANRIPLEMWLDIPDNRDPFYTRGEVAWSSSLADSNQRRVGVRLEKAELMGLARILWIK